MTLARFNDNRHALMEITFRDPSYAIGSREAEYMEAGEALDHLIHDGYLAGWMQDEDNQLYCPTKRGWQYIEAHCGQGTFSSPFMVSLTADPFTYEVMKMQGRTFDVYFYDLTESQLTALRETLKKVGIEELSQTNEEQLGDD